MLGKKLKGDYYYNNMSSEVGIGIVAALEKSQGVRRKATVCVPNWNGSSNIKSGSICDHIYTIHTNYKSEINTSKNKKRLFENMYPETQDGSTMMRSFPTSDFLSSCDMCKKKLHGKDIYMYRGEKAFCSEECRYRQIVMDERKEHYYCTSTSSHVSDSNIFSTGILAL